MKIKALFGLWSEMRVPDINRILKPHGVRLVMKRSKVWGKQVSVTAHPVEVVKRTRAPKEPAPQAPIDPVEQKPGQEGYNPEGQTHPITIE